MLVTVTCDPYKIKSLACLLACALACLRACFLDYLLSRYSTKYTYQARILEQLPCKRDRGVHRNSLGVRKAVLVPLRVFNLQRPGSFYGTIQGIELKKYVRR